MVVVISLGLPTLYCSPDVLHRADDVIHPCCGKGSATPRLGSYTTIGHRHTMKTPYYKGLYLHRLMGQGARAAGEIKEAVE